MSILHRNGIPFFQHLTVSWPFLVERIMFLKRCYACIKVQKRVSSQTPVAVQTCDIKV